MRKGGQDCNASQGRCTAKLQNDNAAWHRAFWPAMLLGHKCKNIGDGYDSAQACLLAGAGSLTVCFVSSLSLVSNSPLCAPSLVRLQLEALLMEICDETSIAELKLKVSPLAALYP